MLSPHTDRSRATVCNYPARPLGLVTYSCPGALHTAALDLLLGRYNYFATTLLLHCYYPATALLPYWLPGWAGPADTTRPPA